MTPYDSASPVSPLPAGTQIGKYRISNLISRGGFSLVYLAQDLASKTQVAIKEYMPTQLARRNPGEFVPHVDPEKMAPFRIGLKCFFDEARTLSGIHHDSIVRVQDFVAANETVYMVMRFESGRSLEEHIKINRNPGQLDVMTEAFIRRVFLPLMTGLQEVHEHGVLHLDIKPANIYLRMNGEPILLDFGTARQTQPRDNAAAYAMYTPGFAAPELHKRDAEVGAWTDVYAVGACIFSCMSGRPAQPSDRRLVDDQMPAILRSFRGPYSNELIAIVESCLTLNSLERPQSAGGVLKMLAKNLRTGKK